MQIQIHDFRGVSDLDATIDGALLIAGPNGAGKSSACVAIAACLTGQLTPFEGVTKAKAHLLVRDGGASATAVLTGPEGGAWVVWPSCERAEKGRAPWASPVAAGLVDPIRMAAKERAAWLIDLIGALPDAKSLSAAWKQTGAPMQECDQTWTAIETRGWDAAHAEAKDQGARLKGQWEKVTGQRYGTAKAAAWKPEGWKSGIDAFGLEELASAAAAANEEIERIRKLGIEGEVKRRAHQDAISAGQRALSERDHAKGYAGAAKAALEEARAARLRLGPPAEYVWNCPCCEARVALIEGELVEAPDNAVDPAVIAKADAAIQTAEQDQLRKQAHYDRILAEIARAETSSAALDEMPTLPETERMEALKTAAEESNGNLRMKRQAIEAGDLHERIGRQIEIVKLLAEDGLRQSTLVEALGGFAGELHDVTRPAGWKPVTIDADMSIAYGGRPVSLCSGGERFRVRCALQIVAARRDESALVILDGADILDKPGRNGLMKAIAGMNAVIGMTMRHEDVPAKLLADGRAVWVGDEPMQVAA